MCAEKTRILSDTLRNTIRPSRLVYIVEGRIWSIKWDGYYLIKCLQSRIHCHTSTSPFLLRNKLVHFGTEGLLIATDGVRALHPSNKVFLTWFHVVPGDPRVRWVRKLNTCVELVHTSCHSTRRELIRLGLDEEKVVVIPLGVDLKTFRPLTLNKRESLRKQIGLPPDAIIIGSFQKDGKGWDGGFEPKLVKGPDVFVEVVKRVAQGAKIHVLLTGPARGYVKRELARAKISYTHVYLKNYFDIVNFYQVLDLYLITSRVEGGPKAILESWATGVPVVSTRVGMVADIAEGGKNVLLCEPEDVEGLTDAAACVIEDRAVRQNLIGGGLKAVHNYTWERVAGLYYQQIYSRYIH